MQIYAPPATGLPGFVTGSAPRRPPRLPQSSPEPPGTPCSHPRPGEPPEHASKHRRLHATTLPRVPTAKSYIRHKTFDVKDH
ncbi:hypothetical protein C6Q17_29750 [Burkholderia contaminans]|nr:hypothetical protein C6Q17_29750 [Burkholderia contaminans]